MPVADCERLVAGWLAQPANALSSLAFVVVGMLVPIIVRKRSGAHHPVSGALGGTMVLVGIGSVAFHGPGGPVSNWIHDASITLLLVLIIFWELGLWAGWSTRRIVKSWMVVSAALLTVELARSAFGDTLNAPLALVAVVGIVGPLVGIPRIRQPERNKQVLAALGLVATGAVIMVLSRTGGPLCAPDAVIQGHALWHVLVAMGLGVYAVSVPVRLPVMPSLSISSDR